MKNKLIKKYSRQERKNLRKGGYHKTKKGDSKEMRKNKQKDIQKQIDESSMTSAIRGYLSNMKQSTSGDGDKKPWYLNKKGNISHSLKESTGNFLLKVILNEIERKDKIKIDPEKAAQVRAEKEKRRASLPLNPKYQLPSYYQDLQNARKEFGHEEDVLEKARQERDKNSYRTDRVKFSKYGIEKGNINDSKNRYLRYLKLKSNAIKQRGITNPKEEDFIKSSEWLLSNPNVLNINMLKSFFGSYPRDMVDAVNDWLQSKGKNPIKDYGGLETQDRIFRLLEEKAPFKLLFPFIDYFKSKPHLVIQQDAERQRASRMKGTADFQPIDNHIMDKHEYDPTSPEDVAKQDYDEKFGNLLTSKLTGVPEEEFSDDPWKEDIYSLAHGDKDEKLQSLIKKISSMEGSSMEKDPVTGERVERPYELSTKDIMDDIGPSNFRYLTSKLVFGNKRLRNELIKTLARIMEVNPKHVANVFKKMTLTKVTDDGVEYKTIKDPRTFKQDIGRFDKNGNVIITPEDFKIAQEIWNKIGFRRGSDFRKAGEKQQAGAVSPSNIMKHSSEYLGGENPIIDYIRDKIHQEEREAAARLGKKQDQDFRNQQRRKPKQAQSDIEIPSHLQPSKFGRKSGLFKNKEKENVILNRQGTKFTPIELRQLDKRIKELEEKFDLRKEKLNKAKKLVLMAKKSGDELAEKRYSERASKLDVVLKRMEMHLKKLNHLRGNAEKYIQRGDENQENKKMGMQARGYFDRSEAQKNRIQKQKEENRAKKLRKELEEKGLPSDKIEELISKVNEKMKESKMPYNLNSLKLILREQIKSNNLIELLLSPETASKEEEVETKNKAWEKAPLAKKKNFYKSLSLSEFFLRGKK